ncbi:23S rRNA pseudouridine1911/1915/1917 synthase [Rubritalea squalenifaciens DSM 18772]|uniref:23S rRNA pseudouridine1911/1915/1917 synthase n=1 Tax=Rubritalea squalenifaciens DSM 18772 TaxID=1123071 RepID=A0A1M6RMB9_9BACT|nr:RluA family pseudouridine synthase [Rubritalea squalenifaciens]SHK33661.1 23S rRNA pseudouridine1911/1915/1917 synthase [Rubritalea squalenifaciens DSM 18772]
MKEKLIAVEEDFAVIDESDDWIVVDKPAPLIVHPTNNYKPEPTLIGGVESLLAYEMINGARLSIINRLDRETSGLVIIAKNRTAARALCRAMERRQVEKTYDALVFGWPEWESRFVDAPILRKGEITPSPIWVKQMVHDEGKACSTGFEVVGRAMVGEVKVTHLKAKPHTGRMHQIRVHAAHLGHPLVGDKIYGADETCYLRFIETGWTKELQQALLMPRQALHACGMKVLLDDGELQWSTGLAADMRSFLDGKPCLGLS